MSCYLLIPTLASVETGVKWFLQTPYISASELRKRVCLYTKPGGRSNRTSYFFLATLERFELPTCGVETHCSSTKLKGRAITSYTLDTDTSSVFLVLVVLTSEKLVLL